MLSLLVWISQRISEEYVLLNPSWYSAGAQVGELEGTGTASAQKRIEYTFFKPIHFQ